MFKCASCGKQSQPGESPVIVPTATRPVLYQYEDSQYIGNEFAKTSIMCEDCGRIPLKSPVYAVKVVECNRERTQTRYQD